MTDRTMLLSDEEVREEGETYTVAPLCVGNFRQGFRLGAIFARTFYEAERNRLLDEIERMKAMVPKWVLKSEAVEPYHFIRHRMVATPEGWDEWWLIAPGEEPK